MASGPDKCGNAAEIDRLALALAKEPGSKAFIPLAEEYGKAGMWQEAASVLEDGLKTYPSFITAMVALGRTYDQMNQPVKAKAILEEAVKLSPDNLRAHRTLAKLYVAQGAKDAALRSCNVILAVNPQDQESLSLRASLGAAAPAEPQHTKSPQDTTPTPAPTTSSEAPQPSPHKSGTTVLDKEPPQSPVVQSVPEELPQNAATPPQADEAPHEPHHARTEQLEQWLMSIQARRRDQKPSNESDTPTS